MQGYFNIYHNHLDNQLHFEGAGFRPGPYVLNPGFRPLKLYVSSEFVDVLCSTNKIIGYEMGFEDAQYLVDYAYKDFIDEIEKQKQMNALTVKEALNKGYTHYSEENEDSPIYFKLTDCQDMDITPYTVLVDKEFKLPLVDHDELRGAIAEYLDETHERETGDCSETVFDIIQAVDFKDLVIKINKELSGVKTYVLTEIHLIPSKIQTDFN
tara:strand:+ start:11709 stop:12341 length:633 start_codon:yes stop_codon:yes gene_type:complete